MKQLFRLCCGILIAFLFLFLMQEGIRAATLTPNLSLQRPVVGESGWGTMLNSNSDILDALFGASSGHDHTGVAGEGPSIAIVGGTTGTLTVGRGGTGSTTAAAARSSLGAAASGANTDITSLKGLVGSDAIGIGTASPTVAITIQGVSLAATSIQTTTESDTENMQLITQRSRLGPAAVQSGDNLGSWSFRGHTGSAYTGSKALIAGVANETWSGTANGTLLRFQTTPNGGTTLTTAMTIDDNGDVGIGDTTPAAPLTVGNGDDFQVSSTGAVTTSDTITSTRSTDLGWTVQNAANQACNTTCTTGACVVGINTAALGNFLACTDATADSCLCAG